MTESARRRWMRRAMLSALTGGGLTAVGLGGPLSGGALAADATTGAAGAGEDTPPPATGTTPEATSTAQQSTTSEPTTTTSTQPAPSSTSAAPPAPAPTPVAPGAPAESAAPTVVVQRTQGSSQAKRGGRHGSKAGGAHRQAPSGKSESPGAKATGGTGAAGNGTGATGPATVPPGTPNNVAPPPQIVAAQAGTLASVLGQSAVSAQALDYYRIPIFLLPIYQAAGIQYGVPWQILAAINEVETDYGTNQSVSTAGAVGWMQFMPETWLQYGVDALGAGYADPYNPVDAIFAAARYLHAAGASSNIHTAILAYNHSEVYVSSVLLRAKLIATYPQSVIATLTGLTEGRLPVAGARIVKEPSTLATPLAPSPTPAPSPAPAPANATAGTVPVAPTPAKDPRFVDLLGLPGAPVTAVEDGRVVKLGHSHKLGNFLALRDVYGDVFTYAGLGSIAPRYHVPARRVKRAKAGKAAAGGVALPVVAATADSVKAMAKVHDPVPTRPASAGQQPVTLHVKTPKGHAVKAAEAQAVEAGVGPEAGAPPGMGKARLFAHPDNPVARVAATRRSTQDGQSDGHGGRWLPLKLGSVVSQGTVLGHLSARANVPADGVGSQANAPAGGVSGQGSPGAESTPGTSQGAGASQSDHLSQSNHLSLPLNQQPGRLSVPLSAQSARLRFAIRPAGDSATIDPRPILANWRQLDTALHPRGAKGTLDLLGATVAQVFLMSQGELERTVLADPGITIYACGRQDIAAGAVDGRVLGILEFLSRSGLKPTVSALRCGHSEYTTSGNVSEHYTGDAVDISEINGVPIAGHQGAGSITDVTIRALLTLQGRFVPHQIISLMQYPEAANTLALPDHWNHIHVGFHPVGAALPAVGSVAATAAHSAGAGQTAPSPLSVTGDLSPAQWDQLLERIAALPAPKVSGKPSSAAIRDPQAASGNRDLGARALPLAGGAEE